MNVSEELVRSIAEKIAAEAADCSGKYQRRGKASGKMAASPWIVTALVTDVAGIICVARPGHAGNIIIVAGTGIGIFNHSGQRRAAGFPVKQAG